MDVCCYLYMVDMVSQQQVLCRVEGVWWETAGNRGLDALARVFFSGQVLWNGGLGAEVGTAFSQSAVGDCAHGRGRDRFRDGRVEIHGGRGLVVGER